MRLHELFEELEKYGIYNNPAPKHGTVDGSQSPLTCPGDESWRKGKKNIYNWFKRPYLTNGPKGNYRLPVKRTRLNNVNSSWR